MSVSNEAADVKGMTPVRLAALVDAYGAEPTRWPADERSQATALIRGNAQADVLLSQARSLDQALDSVVPATVPATLSSRILDGFDQIAARPSIRRFISVAANIVWPGAPMWQPSVALAASLIAGLVLGVMSPLGGQGRSINNNADVSVAFTAPQQDSDANL